MSGALCLPQSNQSGVFGYSQYGIQRNDTPDIRNTSNGNVTCPLVFNYTTGAQIAQVAMTVYDRSAADNVSCTLVLTNLNGDTAFSSSRNTTTTGQAAAITLNWFSVSGGAFGVINCHMPMYDPNAAFGYSHIATYSLQ